MGPLLMNKDQFDKEFHGKQFEHQLRTQDSFDTRAQGVAVGVGTGGSVELMMRTAEGKFMWQNFQPVQTAEMIHLMAAAIGCTAELKPRGDFTCWRVWDRPETASPHPPFPSNEPDPTQGGIGDK